MSNYLTVVVTPQAEERLLRWLTPYLPLGKDVWPSQRDSTEHAVLELDGRGARLHHVARAAEADIVAQHGADLGPGGALFRGYAQSPGGDALVFGAAGAAAAIHREGQGPLAQALGQEWDGSHVVVRWDRDKLSVHADFFRTLPLLYTEGPGFVAFSDSWQVLVRLRTAMGAPVTVSAATTIAMSVVRAITEHPMDAVTACSQVHLASVGSRVVVPLGARGPGEAVVEQAAFPEIFRAPDAAWAETVRLGAITVASTLRALVDNGVPLRLSMSGGGDSRAVLAAALWADPEQRMTTLTTAARSAGNAQDHDVVQDLARQTGLVLGNRRDAPTSPMIRYSHPFAVWMVGSLGLHDRINTYPTRVGTPGGATLTGHGAGTYKATYGWRPFTEVTKGLVRFDPAAGAVAGYLGEEYLRSVGVDPAAEDSSEWHYIGIRNSLHGGRFTLTNLMGFPPLMQRRLTALAHVPVDASQAMPESLRRRPDQNGPRINTSLTAVMLSLLNPELATLPFDDQNKDIDPQTLETIFEATGGPIGENELLEVTAYGSPADIVNGTAETFLSMAESWGQAVALNQEGIAPLIDRSVQIATDLGLKPWYEPVIDRTREMLQETGTPLVHQRGGYGRLLLLLPLADATVDNQVPARTEEALGALQDGWARRAAEEQQRRERLDRRISVRMRRALNRVVRS